MSVPHFGTWCLALAVAQALFAPFARKVWRPLGEVEFIFPFWAAALLAQAWGVGGAPALRAQINNLSLVEPAFVWVAMAICASPRVMRAAEFCLEAVARRLPLPPGPARFATVMTLGPLAGSLITEPAAMTVSALVLRRRFFSGPISLTFMYRALALLFVNVSIGGTLTPFAAPPVLMVARVWGWDERYMFAHFVIKVLVAVFGSTAAVMLLHRRDLKGPSDDRGHAPAAPYPSFARGLGAASRVALFLLGLTVLGPSQTWWLRPALQNLTGGALFWGALGLTSILDNAALTSLGAQIPDLPELERYLLVAGAVAGGGLTVIANAPNPAGCALLAKSFDARDGGRGIRARPLFLSALLPTAFAAACLYYG